MPRLGGEAPLAYTSTAVLGVSVLDPFDPHLARHLPAGRRGARLPPPSALPLEASLPGRPDALGRAFPSRLGRRRRREGRQTGGTTGLLRGRGCAVDGLRRRRGGESRKRHDGGGSIRALLASVRQAIGKGEAFVGKGAVVGSPGSKGVSPLRASVSPSTVVVATPGSSTREEALGPRRGQTWP
jgi:hypothetical protein